MFLVFLAPEIFSEVGVISRGVLLEGFLLDGDRDGFSSKGPSGIAGDGGFVELWFSRFISLDVEGFDRTNPENRKMMERKKSTVSVFIPSFYGSDLSAEILHRVYRDEIVCL